MKFCPECGSKITGGKFCSNCGAPLNKYDEDNSVIKNPNASSALDEAINNLNDLVKEQQAQEDNVKINIIRGEYEKAKKYCESLIEKDLRNRVGYIGLIRVASKNFKEFEGVEIEKQIRIAEEIFGADELLFDAEYTKYISARKKYLEYMSNFEIENGVLKRYYGSNEHVVIPDGVTAIGDNAFCGCCSLISITIPLNVKSIGKKAFTYTNITSITIPYGVTEIQEGTFDNCIRLKNVNIPDSIIKIGRNAFRYCKSLTSVTIPNGVKEIGECVFHLCESLADVSIPDSVTRIGLHAFWSCPLLKFMSIPSSCKDSYDFFPDGCIVKIR